MTHEMVLCSIQPTSVDGEGRRIRAAALGGSPAVQEALNRMYPGHPEPIPTAAALFAQQLHDLELEVDAIAREFRRQDARRALAGLLSTTPTRDL